MQFLDDTVKWGSDRDHGLIGHDIQECLPVSDLVPWLYHPLD
jgi:hypothetical protein